MHVVSLPLYRYSNVSFHKNTTVMNSLLSSCESLSSRLSVLKVHSHWFVTFNLPFLLKLRLAKALPQNGTRVMRLLKLYPSLGLHIPLRFHSAVLGPNSEDDSFPNQKLTILVSGYFVIHKVSRF